MTTSPTGSPDNPGPSLSSGSESHRCALPGRQAGKCDCDDITQLSSSSSSASSSSPSSLSSCSCPSSSSSSSSSPSKSSSSASSSSSPSSDIRNASSPKPDPVAASSRTSASSIATPCIIMCRAPWPVAADRLHSRDDDSSSLRLCDDADGLVGQSAWTE
ncbi:MAG: hypothetical protein C0499_04090 [Zymomonas sp.]|nr:hypothetical protein [Zymomonas sp.]PZP14503.1 MAG: hypothetical protein DI607_08015 [Sphingomonas hengshuiensis]